MLRLSPISTTHNVGDVLCANTVERSDFALLHGLAQLTNLRNLRGRESGVGSSTLIDRRRDSLQVVRVDASAIAAKMVNFKTCGNLSLVPAVHHAVCRFLNTVNAREAVSVFAFSAGPIPASCLRVNLIRDGRVLPLVMSDKVADWQSLDMPHRRLGLDGKASFLAASAHAQTGRIRGRKQCPSIGVLQVIRARPAARGTRPLGSTTIGTDGTLGLHVLSLLHRLGAVVPGGVQSARPASSILPKPTEPRQKFPLTAEALGLRHGLASVISAGMTKRLVPQGA